MSETGTILVAIASPAAERSRRAEPQSGAAERSRMCAVRVGCRHGRAVPTARAQHRSIITLYTLTRVQRFQIVQINQ